MSFLLCAFVSGCLYVFLVCLGFLLMCLCFKCSYVFVCVFDYSSSSTGVCVFVKVSIKGWLCLFSG